jgi:hypothetical protein
MGGAGESPEGFVHNRRFGDMRFEHMIRHIRAWCLRNGLTRVELTLAQSCSTTLNNELLILSGSFLSYSMKPSF